MAILMVGVGGFLGAISRYFVYLFVRSQLSNIRFPAGTLLINSVGCILAGYLMGYVLGRSVPSHHPLLLMASMGFLGSFTTFSTFGLETVELLRNQQTGWAILSVALNLVLGFGGVLIGRAVADWLRY